MTPTDWVDRRLATVPLACVAGFRIAALNMQETADLIAEVASPRRRRGFPIYMTSANGEVISRCHRDASLNLLFTSADVISADGQPMVTASRWLASRSLPERVATTDLFHAVARIASERGLTFYLYGADKEENERAVSKVRALYPRLRIVGHTHGYHRGEDLARKVDEINDLAPDVLWIALGVPREQDFVQMFASRLANVGVIKTSGGLFNFLSGSRSRAPQWIQKLGLEWLWRTMLEPRRLAWRYAVTNPHAAYLLLTRTA